MATAHLIAHIASWHVPGMRDVLLGFSVAAILVIIGIVLIGLQPPR
ncbi:hypothetical protein [Mycolicibacterium fortuitum]